MHNITRLFVVFGFVLLQNFVQQIEFEQNQ